MGREELIKQLLYYLSEENLQKDEFFYKEVSSNPQHFVKLELFIKCNKVKKLGYNSPKDIVQAVTDCKQLQLNEEKNALRSTSLTDLPQFQPKKKIKADEPPQKNPYDKLEVEIFVLSVEKEQQVPFRYIQQALLKSHNVHSPYVRFNKTEGNFAVNKEHVVGQAGALEALEKDGLKVGETVLTVRRAEKEDLSVFWEKHGHHYNGIIENLRKDFNKKLKEERRNEAKARQQIEFDFAGRHYDDINKLKSEFKNILCRNPNNTPLKEEESKMVSELLEFHERGEEKKKGLKHFVVDVHPTYMDTRCLFVVKEDGSREDFSVVKCIDSLEKKHNYSQ